MARTISGRWLAGALAVAVQGCGDVDLTPCRGLCDVPTGQAYDFAAFAAVVDATAARAASPHACAAALPPVGARGGEDALKATQTVVGSVLGVPDRAVSSRPSACGEAGTADCATQFEYDVHGRDGQLAQALAPLARHVLLAAKDVRAVVWTPQGDDAARSPVVTLQGTVQGRLLGIMVYDDVRDCAAPMPPP